jgi:hypothetical protein
MQLLIQILSHAQLHFSSFRNIFFTQNIQRFFSKGFLMIQVVKLSQFLNLILQLQSNLAVKRCHNV